MYVARLSDHPTNTRKHPHAPNASVLPNTSTPGLRQAQSATWAVTMPYCRCTSSTTGPRSVERIPSHAPALSLGSVHSLAYMTWRAHYTLHTHTRRSPSDRRYRKQIGTAPPLLRTRVTTIAESLSAVACIRSADKAQTMLFAFCRQWVWDQTIAFLEKEKYSAQSLDNTDQILSSLHRIIRQNKWPANPSHCVPLLYLLGKAKSLLKGTILWRPIAAIVQPQIQRFYLRNAARAFTLFLRLLVEEITASFLVLRICDLQPWVHGLSDWGCTLIAECDCSGQFNNVTPLSVMQDMSAAIKWLAAKRRWNAKEVVWSIHRDNKHLDRAGVGTTSRFFHMTHTDLENLVYFSLLTDTYTQASGRLWSRTGAIPTGGPFSAQSADLRSVWGAKTRVDLMRRLGQLTFSPRGHPLWSTPRGNTISLAQF